VSTATPTPALPDAMARQRRIRAGLLAEYRHLLHDEDPDSTAPAIRISLTKPSRRTA
jgi:hypothetical protein